MNKVIHGTMNEVLNNAAKRLTGSSNMNGSIDDSVNGLRDAAIKLKAVLYINGTMNGLTAGTMNG